MLQYIYLHIGGFGVQLGEECWNLYCSEHDLDYEGGSVSGSVSSGIHSTFRETSAGHFKPRALFVDMDTTEMIKLKRGENREFFRDQYYRVADDYEFSLFHDVRDYCQKAASFEDAEFVRREVERTDHLGGFIITNSAKGLKSSLCSGRAVTSLNDNYERKKMVAFTDYCRGNSDGIATYFTALYQANTARFTDCTFCVDSDAIGRTFRKSYSQNRPRSIDGLKLIAHAVSSLTMSDRMFRARSGGLCQILANLQMNEMLHYPLLMFGSHNEDSPTTWELTRKVFQPQSCLSSVDFRAGTVFGNVFTYRGIKSRKLISDDFKKLRNIHYYRRLIKGAVLQIENHENLPVIENPNDFEGMLSSVVLASHTTSIHELMEDIALRVLEMEQRHLFSGFFELESVGELSGIASELFALGKEYSQLQVSAEDEEEEQEQQARNSKQWKREEETEQEEDEEE